MCVCIYIYIYKYIHTKHERLAAPEVGVCPGQLNHRHNIHDTTIFINTQ